MSPQRVQRKPLELHVYKIWENSLNGTAYCSAFTSDQDPGYPVNVDLAVLHKRLTDAELAAEVHFFIMADFKYPDDPDMLSDEDWTELSKQHREAESALHRFATLPHYDETGQ